MKNNFFPIPDALNYEINNQGLVRNICTGKILIKGAEHYDIEGIE